MTEVVIADYLLKSLINGAPMVVVLGGVMVILIRRALKELGANTEAIKLLQANSASAEKLQTAAKEISDTRNAMALMAQRLDFLATQLGEIRDIQQQWATAADLKELTAEVRALREWKHTATEDIATLKGLVEMMTKPRAAVG